jgi:hypothetical protein
MEASIAMSGMTHRHDSHGAMPPGAMAALVFQLSLV